MSRTGIHGGLRRGTAAAAFGAVLVLSTGVQASLADDAVPPPQDSPAQASLAGTAADGSTATPRGKVPAIPAVPGALLPAVKASLAPGSTTATAQATAQASMTGLPLPDVPLPTVSGTPLVTGGPTTSTAAPAGGASSTATRPGSGTQPGPTSATAPGVAPAAGTSPAGGAPAPTPPLPGTEAAGQASGSQDAVAAPGGAAGTATGGEAGGDAAGPAASGGAVAPSPTLPTSLPTALSINARQSQPTRVPQAAAAPAGPGRAVSSTGPLPDMPDAMVWLGAGLVGVGAAAGLVFLRMRRP